MRSKDYILKTVVKKGEIRSSDLVKALGISRQTAAQHLRELAGQKKLIRLGTTLDSRYIPFSSKQSRAFPREKTFCVLRRIKGLKEDELFREAAMILGLRKALSPQAYSIAVYAFTEMVNNAVDHSHADLVQVKAKVGSGHFSFEVIDKGVGAYESVRRRFRLKNYYEALEHLMKGKQTTAPEAHSGQGIFFTSRIADRFYLQSADLNWLVDNQKEDQSVEALPKKMPGTRVCFFIKQKSRKDLKRLFDGYSNEEYEFDKSSVLVKLLHQEGEYVSRSEAKRLLLGLEKFKRITFDFRDVKSVGQAFADQIFRVFQQAHPETALEAVHMNTAVEFMVKRACPLREKADG